MSTLFSVQEYKRIQEFPDDWQLAGGLVDRYRQVGNAVPLSLGLAIGKLIVKQLNKQTIINYPSFSYSRYKNTDDIAWEKQFSQTLVC